MKFKRLSLILILCAFVWNKGFSQVRAGLKGGVNIATMTITEFFEGEKKSLLGASISLPVEWKIADNFAIQPELNFIQKGFKVDQSDAIDIDRTRFKVNYLELPILAKFLMPAGDIELYAAVGPYLGYALNGTIQWQYTQTISGQTTLITSEEDVAFKEDKDAEAVLRRLDLGMVFSTGVQVPVGPGSILLDVRYSLGILNVVPPFIEEDIQITHSGMGLSLGYLIPLNN